VPNAALSFLSGRLLMARRVRGTVLAVPKVNVLGAHVLSYTVRSVAQAFTSAPRPADFFRKSPNLA
jgi:hypothetical protein